MLRGTLLVGFLVGTYAADPTSVTIDTPTSGGLSIHVNGGGVGGSYTLRCKALSSASPFDWMANNFWSGSVISNNIEAQPAAAAAVSQTYVMTGLTLGATYEVRCALSTSGSSGSGAVVASTPATLVTARVCTVPTFGTGQTGTGAANAPCVVGATLAHQAQCEIVCDAAAGYSATSNTANLAFSCNDQTVTPAAVVCETTSPTTSPTVAPTNAPSVAPTTAPTNAPSVAPTKAPSVAPTKAAILVTPAPTPAPTAAPTLAAKAKGDDFVYTQTVTNEDNGFPLGAILGIVGGGVGLIILIILAFFLHQRHTIRELQKNGQHQEAAKKRAKSVFFREPRAAKVELGEIDGLHDTGKSKKHISRKSMIAEGQKIYNEHAANQQAREAHAAEEKAKHEKKLEEKKAARKAKLEAKLDAKKNKNNKLSKIEAKIPKDADQAKAEDKAKDAVEKSTTPRSKVKSNQVLPEGAIKSSQVQPEVPVPEVALHVSPK